MRYHLPTFIAAKRKQFWKGYNLIIFTRPIDWFVSHSFLEFESFSSSLWQFFRATRSAQYDLTRYFIKAPHCIITPLLLSLASVPKYVKSNEWLSLQMSFLFTQSGGSCMNVWRPLIPPPPSLLYLPPRYPFFRRYYLTNSSLVHALSFQGADKSKQEEYVEKYRRYLKNKIIFYFSH